MLKPSTLLATILSASTLFAQATTPEQVIANQLKQLDSTITISSVTPTPVKGLYEVVLPDNTILYSSETGEYLLQGQLLQIKDGAVTSPN